MPNFPDIDGIVEEFRKALIAERQEDMRQPMSGILCWRCHAPTRNGDVSLCDGSYFAILCTSCRNDWNEVCDDDMSWREHNVLMWRYQALMRNPSADAEATAGSVIDELLSIRRHMSHVAQSWIAVGIGLLDEEPTPKDAD